MKICGIDQSLSSSALTIFDLNTESLEHSYLIKTLNKDPITGKEFSVEERIKKSVDSILEILNRHNCEFVFLEGLSMNNPNSRSARDLAGLFYSLLITLRYNGFNYDYFPPKTVKAFAVHGKATKEEVFEVLPTEIKRVFLEDMKAKKTTGLYDLSDSYFIGTLGISNYKKKFSHN